MTTRRVTGEAGMVEYQNTTTPRRITSEAGMVEYQNTTRPRRISGVVGMVEYSAPGPENCHLIRCHYRRNKLIGYWHIEDGDTAEHTHLQGEITNLIHDAEKLRGRSISTASPIDGDMLVFDSGTGEWIPGQALADGLTLDAGGFLYFGDPSTNGSWRIGRSGNNLVFERREAGVWNTKDTITP